MRVVILNKSDSTGGAAVVSRRLMEALREEGIDARMLVCEKLKDSTYVELAAPEKIIKWKFLLERLKIFIALRFKKQNLFKIDSGEEGLTLWKHLLVKESDAILINWVNQGMLSLHGLKKILNLGKPVIWTMHDMWNMTGICHHAGKCNHFHEKCGNCPLLNGKSSPKDLSSEIWERKFKIYNYQKAKNKLAFVAVSSWLKGKATESSLLKNQRVEVIPNAFKISNDFIRTTSKLMPSSRVRILFGAARLDDPIKGLETLKETSRFLRKNYPDIAENLEIAMFGNVKDPSALEGFELPVIKLGVLHGEEEVRKAYDNSSIVVSASSYETLPGTLVEAQAYGCIPVSFNQGGQKDIIDNGVTGFLAEYDEDISKRSRNLAKTILKAYSVIKDSDIHKEFLIRMRKNVEERFSYPQIAKKYISLIRELG